MMQKSSDKIQYTSSMRWIFICIVSIFILSFQNELTASAQINKAEVEKHTKEMNFEQKKKIWVPKEGNKKAQKEVKNTENKPSPNFGNFEGLVNIVSIILVALLLIVILYFIGKDLNLRGSKNTAEYVSLDNIDDIKKINFQDMLKEAIANKDFRLAVRIRFLMLLQALQNKNLILWKPDKTNRAYARELSGSSYGQEFRILSTIFEQTWYGDRHLSEDVFNQIDHRFNQLNV